MSNEYKRVNCEGCEHLSKEEEKGFNICKDPGKYKSDRSCWSAKKIGLKFDTGKVKWSDAPWKGFQEVLEVMQYGANKYEVNNWRQVDPNLYFDALVRHYTAWIDGKVYDSESGKTHIAHMACNAIFILELLTREKDDDLQSELLDELWYLIKRSNDAIKNIEHNGEMYDIEFRKR